MATKDIKDFTKYPSLSDNDYLLGTKTDLGGTDAGITVSAFKKQVGEDIKPEIKNGYWWVLGVNTGVLAEGKTPVFRKTSAGLEMKYEGEDDTAYILLIPMADLAFTFDDLTPEQVEDLKLKFTDLTDADKEALRGAAFTYDMFTPEQLADLRLTWDKLTPDQKNEIKGERGYSAFEVWTQQEGNTDKTIDDYLAWLRQPATDAAAEVRKEMAQISQDVSHLKERLTEDAGKVNTDLTAAVEALEGRAETVISKTNTAKEGAIAATGIAMSVSDNPGYIGEDYHVYQWDYTVDNYVKTDRVLRPEGFSIYRQYRSIALMETDKANVPEGKFVLINTGDVEQGDNARLYVKGAADFEYLVDMSGAIGFTGKTPQITIGTVTVGASASASLSPDGTDTGGNPKFKLNLVIVAGPQGLMPTIEMGTTTTGQPGTDVIATLTPNGQTSDGRDKYLLNLTIPQGMPGSGNVSVVGTGLISGKKYLFVPSSDDSTTGTFIEYVAPEIPEQIQPDWNATEGKAAILNKPGNATADTSGLMSADQFQKLEKVSPDDYVKKDGSVPFTGELDVVKDGNTTLRFKDANGDLKGHVGAIANPVSVPVEKHGVWLHNGKSRATLMLRNDGQLTYGDNKVWHAGNDGAGSGLDADTVGGFPASQFFISHKYPVQSEEIEDGAPFVDFLSGSYRCQYSKASDLLISFKGIGSTSAVHFLSDYANTKLACRTQVDNSRYTNWRYIAFKDSNVASATKLNTPRNINSVPFDGTANISIGQLVPIMIEGGTDLNDFTTPGMYFNPSDAVTATIVNVPIAHAFSLLVEKHAGYKQTFTVYGDNFMQMFVRNYDGYSWSPWYKISLGTSTNISNLNVIPVGYDIVTCTLNTNTSITVENAGMAEYNGRTISVYVLCGTTARTITIPTTGNYISMCGSSYTCPANKWVEFNLTCVDGKWHIAKLEQE